MSHRSGLNEWNTGGPRSASAIARSLNSAERKRDSAASIARSASAIAQPQ